jgi:Tfp pilus assembly protein PilF
MVRIRSRKLAVLTACGLVLSGGCSLPGGTVVSPEPDGNTLSAAQVADMQLALGQSLEKQGAGEEARAAYESAVAKDPSRTDAHLKLANLHARRGEFAEADQLYRRVLAADPKNADAYCNLGYAHYLLEDWAEAEAALRHCLSLQPGHSRAHNNLGLVLARQRRPEEALAAFRRAGAGEADARLNLAYVQTLAGDFGAARKEYARVLELDSQSELARSGLTRVDTLAAKFGAPASPAAAKASAAEPDSNAPALIETTAVAR